jgi:polysaccharide deactylase WbmS-like protein
LSEVALTFDVDWAPDFVIEEVAELLAAAGVRATWFITHASPAVNRLRERPDLFELGIHPNFAVGSSHGETVNDVLGHMREVVPEARATRSHRLAVSAEILAAIAADERLKTDSSLFLPDLGGLEPVRQWLGQDVLVRIPYIWADDHEPHVPEPDWSLERIWHRPGLKVFDFHPMLVHLNSADNTAYQTVKGGIQDLRSVRPDDTRDLINGGLGSRTALESAIDRIVAGQKSNRIGDLVGQLAS